MSAGESWGPTYEVARVELWGLTINEEDADF